MAPGDAGGHRIGRVTRRLPMRYLALWRAQTAIRPQEADEKETRPDPPGNAVLAPGGERFKGFRRVT